MAALLVVGVATVTSLVFCCIMFIKSARIYRETAAIWRQIADDERAFLDRMESSRKEQSNV